MLESILTWGRNIGFTGRMAVLEGKTFRVEKPSCAPLRASAALAESVGIDHMRDKELEDQTRMRIHKPVERRKLTFIRKFYKSKAKIGVWITTDSTISHL